MVQLAYLNRVNTYLNHTSYPSDTLSLRTGSAEVAMAAHR